MIKGTDQWTWVSGSHLPKQEQNWLRTHNCAYDILSFTISHFSKWKEDTDFKENGTAPLEYTWLWICFICPVECVQVRPSSNVNRQASNPLIWHWGTTSFQRWTGKIFRALFFFKKKRHIRMKGKSVRAYVFKTSESFIVSWCHELVCF